MLNKCSFHPLKCRAQLEKIKEKFRSKGEETMVKQWVNINYSQPMYLCQLWQPRALPSDSHKGARKVRNKLKLRTLCKAPVVLGLHIKWKNKIEKINKIGLLAN